MSDEKQLWNWSRSNGGHYSKPVPVLLGQGMEALRTMFPLGKADKLNFVLFSTNGVHGSQKTIEQDYAAWKSEEFRADGITFLVVQPRIVAMRYGNVLPMTDEEFEFLKCLRKSSWEVMQSIGRQVEHL